MSQYVGEIRITSYGIVPKGWALCDGRILTVKDNTALFSLLGNRYGGDGKTTFALPNLFDRTAIQCGQGEGLTEYGLGESGGAAEVTLIRDEVPAHVHRAAATTNPGTTSDPTDAVWATGGDLRGGVPLYNSKIGSSMNMNALSEVGGEKPHNNMPPYFGVQYIIAIQGVFPPRSSE
ncbi:MAG TPA: tail fiber protein [Pyrinomonadaceae bacterium]|nr:tail fiber protein [Pyrinomonadaceae bacterium]